MDKNIRQMTAEEYIEEIHGSDPIAVISKDDLANWLDGYKNQAFADLRKKVEDDMELLKSIIEGDTNGNPQLEKIQITAIGGYEVYLGILKQLEE